MGEGGKAREMRTGSLRALLERDERSEDDQMRFKIETT